MFQENVADLEKSIFPTSLVRSLKIFTWHDVLKYASQVQKKIKLNSNTKEQSTKFWESKGWNKGRIPGEAGREADLLEQILLPGHPESEKERLASWLRLPRRARYLKNPLC